jgi:5-methylcytosine-specific restriction protein A
LLIPLKPCTYPGCTKLVPRGRCESHKKQADKLYDKSRENDADRKFIHSDRWRMIRRIKLSNDPLCYYCEREGKVVPAVLVHHLDENELNNEDDNLISCCRKCHEAIHGPNRFRRKY